MLNIYPRINRAYTTISIVSFLLIAEVCSASISNKEGVPFKLSGNNTSVSSFLITPDSQNVIFLDGEGLKITSVNGGPITLISSKGALDYKVSFDGNYVVYISKDSNNFSSNIFSFPIAGGTATQLNQGSLLTDRIFIFEISPNSKRVAFTAGDPSRDSKSSIELFSTPINGGANTKLNLPFPEGKINTAGIFFKFSPDSSKILYSSEQTGFGITELFVVSAKGGTAQKVHGNLQNEFYGLPSRVRQVEKFYFLNDSSSIIFSTFAWVRSSATIEGLFKLDLDGGTPQRLLNNTLGGWRAVVPLAGGDRALVRSGGQQANVLSIISISDPDPNFSIAISPGSFGSTRAGVSFFAISPNNDYIAFTSDHNSTLIGASFADLYLYSLKTGDVIPAFPSVDSGYVFFKFTPDGKHIVGQLNRDSHPSKNYLEGDILSRSIADGKVSKINSNGTSANRFGFTPVFSPDSSRVVFPRILKGEQRHKPRFVSGSVLGKRPILLDDIVNNLQDYTFTNDGLHFIYLNDGELFAVKGWSNHLKAPITPSINCLILDNC